MRRLIAAGILVCLLATALPPATATPTDDPVTVTLNTTSDGYDPGTTHDIDVVVTGSVDTVGAYDLSLTASEGLSIVGYTPASPLGPLGNVSISDDGSRSRLVAADAGVDVTDGTAVLGTLTVRAETNTTATVTPDVAVLTDENGSQYTATTARRVSIQIGNGLATFEGASGPPANVDDDPLLEDVDGDGQTGLFDALTYYNNRRSPTIRERPDRFDFDGDGESGTLFDALALYNEISGAS